MAENKKMTLSKAIGLTGPEISISSSLSRILNQTVLTVDASSVKTYPEILETMRKLDNTLLSVAELQKGLGIQRKRLAEQATILRQSQLKIKPIEGDIRTGINGKSYIFLGGSWGNFIPGATNE